MKGKSPEGSDQNLQEEHESHNGPRPAILCWPNNLPPNMASPQ